mmetsp:Transcript_8247/g.17451  ORF Transcript_8247/g.17451 Transcript_8247/m.17451 type:complete len:238 (-) Transcript_8247:15-728(-)
MHPLRHRLRHGGTRKARRQISHSPPPRQGPAIRTNPVRVQGMLRGRLPGSDGEAVEVLRGRDVRQGVEGEGEEDTGSAVHVHKRAQVHGGEDAGGVRGAEMMMDGCARAGNRINRPGASSPICSVTAGGGGKLRRSWIGGTYNLLDVPKNKTDLWGIVETAEAEEYHGRDGSFVDKGPRPCCAQPTNKATGDTISAENPERIIACLLVPRDSSLVGGLVLCFELPKAGEEISNKTYE